MPELQLTQRHKKYLPHAAAIGLALLARLAAFTAPLEGETHAAVIPVKGDVPTICNGHTHDVHLGDFANHAQCQQYLQGDEMQALAAVNELVTYEIPDTMRIAEADFVFNLGRHAFQNSDVLFLTNQGLLKEACRAILYKPGTETMHYVTAGGRFVPGLVNRRTAEMTECLKDL